MKTCRACKCRSCGHPLAEHQTLDSLYGLECWARDNAGLCNCSAFNPPEPRGPWPTVALLLIVSVFGACLNFSAEIADWIRRINGG